MQNALFYNKIKSLAKGAVRFHVPGHKGNKSALPFMKKAISLDLTEIDGADNLQNPEFELLQSQQGYANIYGSGASLFSAQGSTSCIEAMLGTFLHSGEKLVIARNCHVSAVRAMAFVDLQPVWVQLKNNRPQPQDIENALKESGAKAVYITSPDYYGYIADIKAISERCKKYGARLLVDNAHGAHLKFMQKDMHPLTLGADAVAESAHKTLGCLTGAAVLHLKDKQYAQAAREMLNLFSGTSPSYLILLSLDYACAKMTKQKPNFEKTAKQLDKIKKSIPQLCLAVDDRCKLTILPSQIGYTTAEINNILLKHKIYAEYISDTHIVFMASVYNRNIDFFKLKKALKSIQPRQEFNIPCPAYEILPQQISIRSAVFAEKEIIKTQDAVGRIAAAVKTPCPPGIPVVVPGEKISQTTVSSLLKSGILTLEVVK